LTHILTMSGRYLKYLMDTEPSVTSSQDGEYQPPPRAARLFSGEDIGDDEGTQYSSIYTVSSNDTFSPAPVTPPVASKRDLFFDSLLSSLKASEFILKGVGPVVEYGWCNLLDMATTKWGEDAGKPVQNRRGYIQLSFNGLNKVRTIGEWF